MPDSLLNTNLGPVSWTTGATGREPRPEEGQKREQKRSGPKLFGMPRKTEAGGEVTSAAEAQDTVDATPHLLDRFA